MTIINNILMIAITRGGWLRVSDGGKEAGVSLSPLNGSSQHPCCTLHTAHCTLPYIAFCTLHIALQTVQHYTALRWTLHINTLHSALEYRSIKQCTVIRWNVVFLIVKSQHFFAVFWLLLLHCIAISDCILSGTRTLLLLVESCSQFSK